MEMARKGGLIQAENNNRLPNANEQLWNHLPVSFSAEMDGRPDEFMFRQFRRHSRVLRTAARYDYFMLSGGANLFPVSDVWKELLALEIDSDLAYGWYTSQEGFPSLQRAVSMCENYVASRGMFPAHKPLGRHVCMTLGASQAAAAVFDYWSTAVNRKTVLLVGLNYALFERLARHHGLEIHELLGGEGASGTLPPAEQVASYVRTKGPLLVVLVTPNNPSGEQYAPSDLTSILRAAAESESLVLVDQVGLMPIAQNDWVNIGEMIVRAEAQNHSVLVNSFSKSDGVPGFRLGYLLGPEPVARHAAYYQLTSTMNPPTVPLLPPFFSLLFRCVHVGEQQGWTASSSRESLLSFARHMLEVTTAIAPPATIKEVHSRLIGQGFDHDYGRYISSQKQVGRAIQQNQAFVFERLGKYLSNTTSLQGGFNFLVELEPFAGKDEDDICRRLFDETAVAILTESCFRISRRRRQNFWVRMSLASPPARFCPALEKLGAFLERIY